MGHAIEQISGNALISPSTQSPSESYLEVGAVGLDGEGVGDWIDVEDLVHPHTDEGAVFGDTAGRSGVIGAHSADGGGIFDGVFHDGDDVVDRVGVHDDGGVGDDVAEPVGDGVNGSRGAGGHRDASLWKELRDSAMRGSREYRETAVTLAGRVADRKSVV